MTFKPLLLQKQWKTDAEELQLIINILFSPQYHIYHLYILKDNLCF